MAYILISGKDFNEIRRKIREKHDKEVAFTSNDDELSRKVLEKEKINALLINQAGRRDSLKQRNSGFNQVLAKIAKKKQVSVGINLEEVLAANLEAKAEIIARIIQNIELCKKNKLKIIFFVAKERNQYDLKALGLVLGMPTWMTKDLNVVKLG
jgi:RNase P/RNase MRP subunit p30